MAMHDNEYTKKSWGFGVHPGRKSGHLPFPTCTTNPAVGAQLTELGLGRFETKYFATVRVQCGAVFTVFTEPNRTVRFSFEKTAPEPHHTIVQSRTTFGKTCETEY